MMLESGGDRLLAQSEKNEAEAHARGIREGEQRERARVVALLDEAIRSHQQWLDELERGDHEGTKGGG